MIASWFVADICLPRKDARAKHTVQAVGSGDKAKAERFVSNFCSSAVQSAISCYGSYQEVYEDPNVDIVYIATPHAFHKQNCLDAIRAGKHVLCEKPFAINAKEAKEVIDAARGKGVFVMEGMWTRFFPIVQKLQELLHKDEIIGDVSRTFADFSLDMPLQELPPTSRLRDIKLGAGSLLDIGIYSLTWALLTLESPRASSQLQIKASQTLLEGVDVSSSALLYYPDTGKQGIVTSSLLHKTDDVFARVEGTRGTLFLSGDAGSMPNKITVSQKPLDAGKDMGDKKAGCSDVSKHERTLKFEEDCGGRGFYYEADAVALDISAGRKESEIMPLDETLRVMQILDEIRVQGGGRFPQDEDA